MMLGNEDFNIQLIYRTEYIISQKMVDQSSAS